MSSIGKMRCRLLGHRRLRAKVWHDGLDYRAPCAHCGTPLLRDMNGTWRPFDWAKDTPPPGSQERSARPHHPDR